MRQSVQLSRVLSADSKLKLTVVRTIVDLPSVLKPPDTPYTRPECANLIPGVFLTFEPFCAKESLPLFWLARLYIFE